MTLQPEYWVTIEPEEIPVEGNAMASGDDEADRAEEQAILERLDAGDDWAWCTVVVHARLGDAVGTAALGCCSYADEDDFKAPGGYYEDLCAEALEDIPGSAAILACDGAPDPQPGELARLRAFVERWRDIVAGYEPSAEGWARAFDREAGEALRGEP